jgi:hypothetical protein
MNVLEHTETKGTMNERQQQPHTFHIPVMGLGYTIDTPLKVARFGISSVVSIIEDELVERMGEFHCGQSGEPYEPVPSSDPDHRARRVTAYLDLMDRLVKRQVEALRQEPFVTGTDIVKYFGMLPDTSPHREMYKDMMAMAEGHARQAYQDELRRTIRAGSIDVNIMSKIDRTNYNKEGEPLPPEFADAMAAFRGFAKSTLSSSIVLSAGYNPRVYAYIAQFNDFLPDVNGALCKKVILKVSDLRSALIQGKILAKKGVWVSEFRIESGLNCGGHAFATDGILLGPILQEFHDKRKRWRPNCSSSATGHWRRKESTSSLVRRPSASRCRAGSARWRRMLSCAPTMAWTAPDGAARSSWSRRPPTWTSTPCSSSRRPRRTITT